MHRCLWTNRRADEITLTPPRIYVLDPHDHPEGYTPGIDRTAPRRHDPGARPDITMEGCTGHRQEIGLPEGTPARLYQTIDRAISTHRTSKIGRASCRQRVE